MTTQPREFWLIYFKNGRCQVSEKLVTEFDEYFGPPNYEAELPIKVTHVIEAAPVLAKIARLEAALQRCKEQRDQAHLQFWDEVCPEWVFEQDNKELDSILEPEKERG